MVTLAANESRTGTTTDYRSAVEPLLLRVGGTTSGVNESAGMSCIDMVGVISLGQLHYQQRCR